MKIFNGKFNLRNENIRQVSTVINKTFLIKKMTYENIAQ